ncbi:hypothetical protein Tco_0066817 [Tanacetum coccineum]
MAELFINSLDNGNPLFLQNNDNSNALIVNVKLTGYLSPELYLGQVYSEIDSEVWQELEETFDKMDSFVIHKIYDLKQGDLYVPDYYHKLNSLWREFDALTLFPAYICTEAFNVVSMEESYRGLHHGSVSSSKVQPDAFVVKTNQPLIVSTDNMFNVVDISNLNLTVGHPSGTLAKNYCCGKFEID